VKIRPYAKACFDEIRMSTTVGSSASDVELLPIIKAHMERAVDDARQEIYEEFSGCTDHHDLLELAQECAERYGEERGE